MTPDTVPQVPVDPPSSSDPVVPDAANTQAAPSVDPVAPPPADDVAQAGAEVPPADAPPGGALGAAAPPMTPHPQMILDDFDPDLAALANPTLIESRPLIPPETPSADVIDTPAKALEVLGAESGVPAGTVDNVTLISVAIPEEREPADVIDELRRKLYAYGEECYNAVRPEVEYLQQLHTRL